MKRSLRGLALHQQKSQGKPQRTPSPGRSHRRTASGTAQAEAEPNEPSAHRANTAAARKRSTLRECQTRELVLNTFTCAGLKFRLVSTAKPLHVREDNKSWPNTVPRNDSDPGTTGIAADMVVERGKGGGGDLHDSLHIGGHVPRGGSGLRAPPGFRRQHVVLFGHVPSHPVWHLRPHPPAGLGAGAEPGTRPSRACVSAGASRPMHSRETAAEGKADSIGVRSPRAPLSLPASSIRGPHLRPLGIPSPGGGRRAATPVAVQPLLGSRQQLRHLGRRQLPGPRSRRRAMQSP